MILSTSASAPGLAWANFIIVIGECTRRLCADVSVHPIFLCPCYANLSMYVSIWEYIWALRSIQAGTCFSVCTYCRWTCRSVVQRLKHGCFLLFLSTWSSMNHTGCLTCRDAKHVVEIWEVFAGSSANWQLPIKLELKMHQACFF